MTTEQDLAHLSLLVGSWTTEATHPAMPGVVVEGTAEIAWLEGERFLVHRGLSEHPDFPDFIAVLGHTGRDRAEGEGERLTMHYFDSRGVSRVYEVAIDDSTWRIWRDAPGFSQRFTGTFADGGDTIEGLWQMNENDATWNDDLQITYRRVTRKG